MKLLVEAPINSLSLGNVTVNILRELYKKNVEVGLFPVGNTDVSAYSLDKGFLNFLQKSVDNRFSFLDKEIPSFRLWHLNGAENRKNPKQHLFSFYECSNPTDMEVQIAKAQDTLFFSSNYAKDLFDSRGCDSVSYVPLGFDEDFKPDSNQSIPNIIHFGLMGKFEHRKHSAKIIQNWLRLFGNNPRYLLTCCVTNPFFKPEDMAAIQTGILDGKNYSNINFLPYLSSNKEVNMLLNSIDIDLTGLSGAEGWNLPAFNATCLGKWSVVLNATSHKDWATEENSILVEPSGIMDCYDETFFKIGGSFNQGQFFTWTDQEFEIAMEKALAKTDTKSVNSLGLELGKEMTYSKTTDAIINQINK